MEPQIAQIAWRGGAATTYQMAQRTQMESGLWLLSLGFGTWDLAFARLSSVPSAMASATAAALAKEDARTEYDQPYFAP